MIALFVMFFIILLILFVPVSVSFSFSEHADFNIKVLWFTVYSISEAGQKSETNPKKKTDDDQSKATDILKTVKTYFSVVTDMLKVLYRYLKSNLKIRNLDFSIAYGLGDAAVTGIFSGAVYTVVNTFYAYILNNFTVKKHSVKVNPDFENRCFDIKFFMNFKISLMWLLCLLFHERKAINKLLKILKKDGVNNE